MGRRLVVAALALLPTLATAVRAEEAATPPPPPAPVAEPSRFVAAAWCPLRRSRERAAAVDPDAPPPLRCDAGMGVALWRRGRFAVPGFLGPQSLGLGVSLVVHRSAKGAPFAVGVGAMVPWDSGAVYWGEVAPAIGATVSAETIARFMRGLVKGT